MLFEDQPIRRKLQRVILATSISVLVLTCTAFIAYEYFTFRRDMTRNLLTLAKVVASNTTGTLAFQDPDDAQTVLSALAADPHVVSAVLFNRDGEIFATYRRAGAEDVFPQSPPPDGERFERRHLIVVQPVAKATRQGTLFLKSDMGAMHARFQRYAGIVLLVITGSVLLALGLATRLQKRISSPITALAETARSISRDKDYSVRARKESDDEIGLLTEAFNEMLTQIQDGQEQLSCALAESRERAAEISKLNAELEERVQQRTAALQEAVAQMEAFSYSVSHDLRAPLRAMHGYAQALIQDCGDQVGEEGLHYILRIKKSAERLDHLIQDVLTYSRVARAEMPPERVQLDRLVPEIIQQYPSFQPPMANIRVQSPLLDVIGHEASLTQCISNLFSNAVKFVPPGRTPEVRIRTEPIDGRVRLWVEDNGIGISPEFHDRIFRMFERLNSDKAYEGTGIGLAIVKKAVERMGGRIGLESAVEKGTRFWIELPGT